MLNGNAATEIAVTNALPDGFSLRSALAIPLDSETGLLGVLTLYSKESAAFHGGDLRLCMSLQARLAFALEAGLLSTAQRAVAGYYAGSDVPNAGSLLKHLDGVLLRTATESVLVVVVRLQTGLADSMLPAIKAVVQGFDSAGGFVARASEEDYVAVFLTGPGNVLTLETALSSSLHRAGYVHDFSLGVAEAPTDAKDAESLLATAVSRLRPSAVSGSQELSASLSALSRAAGIEHEDSPLSGDETHMTAVPSAAGGRT